MTWQETRNTYPTKPDAWVDGFVNGSSDRLLGIRLDVAIFPDQSQYSQDYTSGYRAAQL